jgi:hypothetical protein
MKKMIRKIQWHFLKKKVEWLAHIGGEQPTFLVRLTVAGKTYDEPVGTIVYALPVEAFEIAEFNLGRKFITGLLSKKMPMFHSQEFTRVTMNRYGTVVDRNGDLASIQLQNWVIQEARRAGWDLIDTGEQDVGRIWRPRKMPGGITR